MASTADEKKDSTLIVHPNADELCSAQLRTFLRTYKAIFDFFFFGIQLATQTDKNRMTAAKALATIGRPEDQERLKELEANPEPAFGRLAQFSRLQSENMTLRVVDNFTSYLSEIVQVCMMKRPEILRSKEQIRIDEVLRFSSYKELIRFLVNRKVNELSYKGITDIEEFLLDRTGILLTQSERQKANLMLGIELRNVITHNRGVVSDVTIRRLAAVEHGRKVVEGEVFHVEFDDLIDISSSLVEIARTVDEAFCAKFRIRRRKFQPTPSQVVRKR
jgi:hypothetical protein